MMNLTSYFAKVIDLYIPRRLKILYRDNDRNCAVLYNEASRYIILIYKAVEFDNKQFSNISSCAEFIFNNNELFGNLDIFSVMAEERLVAIKSDIKKRSILQEIVWVGEDSFGWWFCLSQHYLSSSLTNKDYWTFSWIAPNYMTFQEFSRDKEDLVSILSFCQAVSMEALKCILDSLQIGNCSICGEVIDCNNFAIIQEKIVCSHCKQSKFVKCHICDCLMPYNEKQEIYNFDREKGNIAVPVCESCAQSSKRCAGCYKPVKIGVPINGNLLCHSCLVEIAHRCLVCGRWYIGEDNLCDNCLSREAIEEYHHSCDLPFYGRGDKIQFADNKERYYGIEIEVETSEPATYAKELIAKMSCNKTVFVIKKDGSLQKGFEIVTAPRTLENWMKYNGRKMLKELTNYFDTKNIIASERCGLHIHVSRSSLTEEQIARAITFFNKHWDHIVKFSMRRSIDYCQDTFNATYLGSPISYNALQNTLGLSMCIAQGKQKVPIRNTAINVWPKDTIEFRIFAGTTQFHMIIANLQFLDCLFEIGDDSGFSDIYHIAGKKGYNELCSKIIHLDLL